MPPFFLSALKQNLARLCWIRAILLGVQCLALLYAYTIELVLPYGSIGRLLAISLALIGFTLWRTGHARGGVVSELEFLVHLMVDVTLLCGLLYLTGGASNPLVSLLLIPLTISAAVLPASYTRVITVFSLLGYSLLLFYYVPLELLSAHHTPAGISPHIAGMWFTFMLSALLITYFINRMGQALREQERNLQQAREDTLRNEQVLAVATLAAGAAHELGTPLSTMRVLLAELEREIAEDNPLSADIKLLGAQVSRCKASLETIVQSARNQVSAEDQPVATGEFFARLLDNWRSMYPEVGLNIEISAAARETGVGNTTALAQALINLLNNAAEVSEVVELQVTVQGKCLLVLLRDYGPGIPGDVLAQVGQFPLGSNGGGMGLGLFLTHATIERIGGTITLENLDSGGSVIRITIPFEQVKPNV